MSDTYDPRRTYAIDGYTTSRHTGEPEPLAMHVQVPGEHVARVLAMYDGQTTVHGLTVREDGVI